MTDTTPHRATAKQWDRLQRRRLESDHVSAIIELRATRRPKPPSLVEEALNALVHLCDGASNSMDTVEAAEYIQRALERLQQLEDSND